MTYHEELFLDHKDKTNLMQWKYGVVDNSITTELLTPFWNWLITLIPMSVAPNQLTASSLICMLLATYTCGGEMMTTHPIFSCLLVAILIFASASLDAVDGKQARRTKNSSFIGELFDHGCDCVCTILLCYMVSILFGIESIVTRLDLIIIGQICFLVEHLNVLTSIEQKVVFHRWTGPGEILCLIESLFVIKALTLLFIWPFGGQLPFIDLSNIICYIFIIFVIGTIVIVYNLSGNYLETRKGLAVCLCLRLVTTFYLTLSSNLSDFDIICSGLPLCILSGDIILAKMARRQLHPSITIFILFSSLQIVHYTFAILPFLAYFCAVFYDLCKTSGLPMMSIVRNVYVDGSYDMMHYGHMKSISKALEYGNRIIIGVMTDQDSVGYKRPPVINQEQRRLWLETFVQACRFVYEIVDCPYPSMDVAFIKRHNIHDVVCSEEYDPQNPKNIDNPKFVDYYKVPRDNGVEIHYQPRTGGISTSEIIQAVKSRSDL